jgi:cytochrome c2
MNTRTIVLLLALPTVAVISSFISQQSNGEKTFKQSCAACHSIGNGKIVGPDLKGVTTRRTEAWLIKFIKSSQTMVKGGDKTAVALFNENNKIVMPDQNLSDVQIKEVLAYIKSLSPAPVAKPKTTPGQIKK